jgi:nickel/cobalt transporter (NicO) family protein
MIRRLLVVGTLALGFLAAIPARPASAHPLGNFTVNQHSGLVVSERAVSVELVVDMAEIPAFQARQEIDTDRDNEVSTEEGEAYRGRECTGLRRGLTLRLGDQPRDLVVRSSELAFPPGQAGLATLRLTCRLEAEAAGSASGARLEFSNSNFSDRVGWREITAAGDGVRLAESDVASRSPSRVLTRYPTDLLSSPLDQRRALLRVAPGASTTRVERPGAPAGPLPRGVDRFSSAFTSLVARQQLTLWFGLVALASAVALGAIHALAPGHGKTVMAAYLVGERGSLRQALLLGLSVTVTHTVGVLVLGALLSGSATFVPEELYPWLSVLSGALLAAVGVGLLGRAWRRRRAGIAAFVGHVHHGENHQHHGEADHHHHPHGQGQEAAVSRGTLMAMGAAGGMVPSPSALVVLLGAIALGRTWFGISLVLGYGLGMALTLVGAGLLLVRARSSLDGRLAPGGRLAFAGRVLPVVTASLVVVAGLGLSARAFTQIV